jgi:hypothetical protein
MKAYSDQFGHAVYIQQLSKFSGNEVSNHLLADFRLIRGNDEVVVETSRSRLRSLALEFDQLLIEAKQITEH